MPAESLFALAADVILVAHVAVVAFIVLGFASIWVGKFLAWSWVHNFRFRLLHLAAITLVVLQAWVGAICPLTTWEMRLREMANQEWYEGSFVQYWLQAILYYDAPGWVFGILYTVFGGLVVASWFIVPPRRNE